MACNVLDVSCEAEVKGQQHLGTWWWCSQSSTPLRLAFGRVTLRTVWVRKIWTAGESVDVVVVVVVVVAMERRDSTEADAETLRSKMRRADWPGKLKALMKILRWQRCKFHLLLHTLHSSTLAHPLPASTSPTTVCMSIHGACIAIIATVLTHCLAAGRRTFSRGDPHIGLLSESQGFDHG